jgi:hypothetical protein
MGCKELGSTVGPALPKWSPVPEVVDPQALTSTASIKVAIKYLRAMVVLSLGISLLNL